MKKRDFMGLIAYTVSLLVLALGMCFYTLPDWGMASIGMPLAIVGTCACFAIMGFAKTVSW